MRADEVARVLAEPLSQQLLTGGGQLARLAYNAPDGSPRVIPIGFLWDGSSIVVCTVPGSAKVWALEADPKVALTIDTNAFPPKALFVRGSVRAIELVDGVPQEYIDASRNGVVPDEQVAAFETDVRDLHEQMVRITITPEWAKLLDFETTLPTAVERLARASHG